ncbi:class I SAM-dependent methyltransferase [Croceicoccus sp. F390]|uniref:Class I SAM-dependent methyltransferase n=1 Tax=Croceicoccus esteveae TaxID=3075597 RepID=A0ABU2ZK33_9SPHN|nr:class I SAM-dependent methyltransferase [Croceicoccus sp. F390]MDT0576971.1 class I SAM-dependent methyltransferase [Croceicoccus sp. F390]
MTQHATSLPDPASGPISGKTPDDRPDLVSSSRDYARRFAGQAGERFLARQNALVGTALADKRAITILDVGGGHGQLAPWLQLAGHTVTVLGSAPLDEPHKIGKAHFVQGSLVNLPFPDKAFDTVIAVRMLAHVHDWQKFISELCRVAANSVIVDFPALESTVAVSALLPLKQMVERDARPFRRFRKREIAGAFGRCAFDQTAYCGEWLLPMALHRIGHGAWPLRWVEAVGKNIGLTRRFGNPVIMRADRRPAKTAATTRGVASCSADHAA